MNELMYTAECKATKDIFEYLNGDIDSMNLFKMADYIEIYHLDSENTAREPVTDGLIENVESEIRQAADSIQKNDLPKRCRKESCFKCHLRHLCLNRAEQKNYV